MVLYHEVSDRKLLVLLIDICSAEVTPPWYVVLMSLSLCWVFMHAHSSKQCISRSMHWFLKHCSFTLYKRREGDDGKIIQSCKTPTKVVNTTYPFVDWISC